MKKTLLYLTVLLLLVAGCHQVVFWKYGIHQPKQETPASIKAFLKEINQPLNNQYMFKDSTSYLRFLWDTVVARKLFRTLFFTEAGLLTRLVDSSSCQWSGGNYILGLKRDTLYYADTTCRYQNLIKGLIPLGDEDSTRRDTLPYDFTLIVTWANFLGKYNERLFINDMAIAHNVQARIRIYYINIDMQQEWNLNDLQALKLR